MRVGIVSKWFNRGQPVVGRQLRSALDELGHETFVLARPKKERGPRPGALDRDDVWDQPGVTEASAYDIAGGRVRRAGSRRTGSRRSSATRTTSSRSWRSCVRAGCATIGRFVWEHFTAEHVAGASRGLRRRLLAHPRRAGALPRDGPGDALRALGLPPGAGRGRRSRSRRRRPQRRRVTFVCFRGGSWGTASRSSRCSRRSRRPTIRACGWWSRRRSSASSVRAAAEAAERDPRIELRLADQPTAEHLREVAGCRRLPRAGALGGPRAAAVRGDRLRDARDHQRRARR